MNEENLKNAFSRVKDDIEQLKTDILSSKITINEQNRSISALNSKISELLAILNDIKNQVSTGNQGVQSINHSTINQSITKQSEEWTEHSEEQVKQSKDFRGPNQSIIQQNTGSSTFSKVRELNETLSKTFQSLTNQEFLVFLTIYQLEDEFGSVSYAAIAAKTNLTSGCIRGYVSTLIQKGTPIIKTRLKNRQTSLTIDKSFRLLGLKDKLINLFYQQDPHQTTFSSSHF